MVPLTCSSRFLWKAAPNFLPWQPVAAAAAVHLERWIVDGTTPPSVTPISVAGDPPTIERDEHGNALGGVRLPDVEVPTATVTGFGDGGGLMELLGSRLPFSSVKLHALYETHDRYVAQVKPRGNRGGRCWCDSLGPHAGNDRVRGAGGRSRVIRNRTSSGGIELRVH